MGALPSCFVFFEETTRANEYDFWWVEDKAIVAARYSGWVQGQSSQYGRGRLGIIIPAPAPRSFVNLP